MRLPLNRTWRRRVAGSVTICFAKDGHYYRFACASGEECELLRALLSAATNPHLNLDLDDVRHITEAVGLAQRTA